MICLQDAVVSVAKDVKSPEKNAVKESSDKDASHQSNKEKQTVNDFPLINCNAFQFLINRSNSFYNYYY